MRSQHLRILVALLMILVTAVSIQPIVAQDEGLIFGMLMVGPYNDNGWSQAHYEAGLYVEENLPGSRMIYIDRVNPADRPGTTPDQLAEELLDQGAKVIIFNSDDMKDASTAFARKYPDIPVIHVSGDQAWAEGENYLGIPNLGNVFPLIEPVKSMAGCAAALTTKTGQIGYLGPLINDETRRLAAASYLGARYCWTEYLGNDPADLKFRVDWIGFWFNIPGVTADPTQVADNFYNSGYDVVISGIDTTEALVQAKAATDAGNPVFNVAYDYEAACDVAPEVCMGVVAFNWRPFYLAELTAVAEGTWTPSFQWPAPDYENFEDLDITTSLFINGPALTEEVAASIEQLKQELADGLDLWAGPINLQDGTNYVAEGETATLQQIWYLPQLLEGMEGQSVPE
jgi:simple sugar transport system substrate-binding protein